MTNAGAALLHVRIARVCGEIAVFAVVLYATLWLSGHLPGPYWVYPAPAFVLAGAPAMPWKRYPVPVGGAAFASSFVIMGLITWAFSGCIVCADPKEWADLPPSMFNVKNIAFAFGMAMSAIVGRTLGARAWK